ncbi:aquaporin-11-like [Eucyclogobius newberryi]|uniref:aquaporin-11-like n=1 Tax=Eucyclogobius newberryi TaxID=166745 RepID=UPI003B59717F
MSALLVSLAVVGAVVLLCELGRWAAGRYLPGARGTYLRELVSTLQLCWCASELKLLGDASGALPLHVRLTLLYVVTLVHLVTFREASCSFIPPLERVCRGESSVRAAAALVSCQLLAALAAQPAAVLVWSRGWSEVHATHRRFGYKCFDPLGGTVLEAAAAELICSFIIQAVVLHLHKLEPKLRVHALSAAITALVYAGGAISGAVLNPVLALSLQFPCSGHSYLQYMFVYWLGPTLGVASCNLLFEIILPFLCGRSSIAVETHKQKTQ